ncbi:MAG: DMT family transporter [Pseudomonadota bacterium]
MGRDAGDCETAATVHGSAAANATPVDLLAVVLMITGITLAALNGALMKVLSQDMSEFMIVWARYAGFALLMLPLVVARDGAGAFSPARPGLQVLRALAMATATVCFVAGARTLNFADAIAIIYIYPFILVLLAPVFLGERVPTVAWVGVVGGFIGVLVVMRPSFDRLDADALLVLFCGLMVAIHLLLNRKLAPLSDPMKTSFWGALIVALGLAVTLPFVWQTPDRHQMLLLGGIAATSAVGQSIILYAFSRAEASALAPFTYSEIVGAIVIAWLIFGTVPDSISWLGMALIVASGVIVARTPRLGAKTARKRSAI